MSQLCVMCRLGILVGSEIPECCLSYSGDTLAQLDYFPLASLQYLYYTPPCILLSSHQHLVQGQNPLSCQTKRFSSPSSLLESSSLSSS